MSIHRIVLNYPPGYLDARNCPNTLSCGVLDIAAAIGSLGNDGEQIGLRQRRTSPSIKLAHAFINIVHVVSRRDALIQVDDILSRRDQYLLSLHQNRPSLLTH